MGPDMSSILDNPDVRRKALPISVDQYHQLGRTGIIGKRTELVCGVILEKMIKSPRHTWLVQALAKIFRESMDASHHLRQEQPLTLADSEPEPDIAIVAGSNEDYRDNHPTRAKLVIEVAISTVELDREKAAVYAAAGIPEYWLFLPDEKTVEVFSEPTNGRYKSKSVLQRDQTLRWHELPDVTLALDKFLSRDTS